MLKILLNLPKIHCTDNIWKAPDIYNCIKSIFFRYSKTDFVKY